MSQITTHRCLCLHPCEAGTCLQLPHFRAHPCPQKPRAILALSPQSGFPACCPELQHIPSPPHGAERDHVTHQNGKGQLTPPKSTHGIKHRTGNVLKHRHSKPSTRLGGEVLQGRPPPPGGS